MLKFGISDVRPQKVMAKINFFLVDQQNAPWVQSFIELFQQQADEIQTLKKINQELQNEIKRLNRTNMRMPPGD